MFPLLNLSFEEELSILIGRFVMNFFRYTVPVLGASMLTAEGFVRSGYRYKLDGKGERSVLRFFRWLRLFTLGMN